MRKSEDLGPLIARAGRGDRRAFAALQSTTAARVFGVILQVIEDEELASAALRDTFVSLWVRAEQYSDSGLTPWAWIVTLARDAAVSHLHRLRTRHGGGGAAELADLSSDRRVFMPTSEGSQMFVARLARLDPEHAEALCRAWFEGESRDDLARRFGVPPATMRQWLRRSLARLRDGDATAWDEPAMLAAEHALGLLTEEEARAFEPLLIADPSLRAERARWIEVFAVLSSSAPEVLPPPGVFAAVEAELFPEDAQGLWRRLGVGTALLAAAVAGAMLFAADRASWLALPGDETSVPADTP